MFNKLPMTIAVFFMAISTIYAQPNWQFVGPKSNNNANGNEFETSQMSDVIADPNAVGHLFARSNFGGLWERYFTGTKWVWKNIDMSSTGLKQTSAIAIRNSSEILVANYCESPVDYTGFSTKVSRYNFTTQSWTHYPQITGITGKYTINSVAVHNVNPNIIYAATSVGLYRYNGSTWTQLVANCDVRKVFFHDYVCYISGKSATNWTSAAPMLMASTNSVTFNSISLGVSSTNGMTEICTGPSNKVYALTVAGTGPETRYIHEVYYDGTTFTTTELHQWNLSGWYVGSFGRMPIVYDPLNNWIWTGAVRLYCYDVDTDSFTSDIKPSSKTLSGNIHDDMHGFCISGCDLFVANDGGIARGSLCPEEPPFSPSLIYFNRDNDSLNVSLLWGFSGSEKMPNIYAFGQQDIISSDIYDATPGVEKDVYRQNTHENDGAFIDKYNENFVIFDQYINSQQKRILTNGWGPTATLGSVNFYYPNASAPFSPGASMPEKHVAIQRTVQDPYRPGRIFEMGKWKPTGFSQFHYPTNSFVLKAEFDNANFGTGDEQSVIDLSFSPETKNSLYVCASGIWYPYTTWGYKSKLFKYNGPDIEDCWYGHNMLWSNGTTGIQQWIDITPPYISLSSIQIEGTSSFGINMIDGDRARIIKIETSPWNKDIVYAAVDFGDATTNGKFSVLKYNGTSWVDYSNGIPENEIPYSMEMDYFSHDALYLVTDLNVYYRDAKMSSWIPYSGGVFPQARTLQMEINYNENTLRAGTYGRGIWKTPLQCPTTTPINHTGTKSPDIYEASSITSSAIMTMSGAPTAYRGVNSVVLNPGFKAEGTSTNNRYFYAFIHGCNGGGSSIRYSTENSSWEEIGFEEEKESALKAYPNPANQIITIDYQVKEGTIPQLYLYDVSGKKVQELNLITFEGRALVEVSEVENGVYLISLFENGVLVNSQKVVVSH